MPAWIAWSRGPVFSEREFYAGTRVPAGRNVGRVPRRPHSATRLGIWLPGSAWNDVAELLTDDGTDHYASLSAAVTLGAGQYRQFPPPEGDAALTTLRWGPPAEVMQIVLPGDTD